MRDMRLLILLAVVSGVLAGESDTYTQGLAELRRAQTDHAALVPAIRLLAKAAAEFEASGDVRVTEVNSALYWARKRMTLADTGAVKSDTVVVQKIEAVSKVIPVDQAKAMLDAAETFAAKSQDSLLIAVRFFEVADRFPETLEGRKAMSKSLEAMARVGTEKLVVYKSVATDGKAFIQSEPAGAQIILVTDEGRKDTGKKTPSLIELPKGQQFVELILKGFKPGKLGMTINGTINKPDRLLLDPLTVPIDVIFEPGWRVFVNGKIARATETPCTIELTLGKHELGLAKEGFADIKQAIEVVDSGVKVDIKGKISKGVSTLINLSKKQWQVVFRSDDPQYWNTNTQTGQHFSVLLDSVPGDIRFLKVTRTDTNEDVVIPVTKDGLQAMGAGQKYGWNGSNAKSWGGYHLGIYDLKKVINANTPKGADICVALDGGKGYSGWGFGHMPHANDSTYCTWGGKEIKKTVLEISVAIGMDERTLLK